MNPIIEESVEENNHGKVQIRSINNKKLVTYMRKREVRFIEKLLLVSILHCH